MRAETHRSRERRRSGRRGRVAVVCARPRAAERRRRAPAWRPQAAGTVPPTYARAQAAVTAQSSAQGSRAGRTVPSLAMLAALVYFVAPLVWLVIASSKTDGDLFTTFGGWFAEFHLHTNIRDLFSGPGGDYPLWL